MSRRSKRYQKCCQKISSPDPLNVPEAVEVLKKFDGAKFDETVELAVRLGIDPKQTAQTVRGTFSLPHGIGKKVRVAVFAEGEAAAQAKEAGAIEVGGEALAKKITDGWLDFDVAIAHPTMMKHVGKLGRILGPHGKMPSPKSGTVTENIRQVVAEFVAGKVEFRNDDAGNVHVVMGKKSFSKEHLINNITAFLDHLKTLRPAAAKGNFILTATVTTTMGPGIHLKVA